MALISDSHALVPSELSPEAFIVFRKLKWYSTRFIQRAKKAFVNNVHNARIEWKKLRKEMQAIVQRKKIVGRRAKSVVQGARSQLNFGDQNIQRLTTLSLSNRSFWGSSSDECDSGNPPGQLNFEYLEHDQPFSREPLVDKGSMDGFRSFMLGSFMVLRCNSLLRAADSWLWLLQVNHPDFCSGISISVTENLKVAVIYHLQVGFQWHGFLYIDTNGSNSSKSGCLLSNLSLSVYTLTSSKFHSGILMKSINLKKFLLVVVTKMLYYAPIMADTGGKKGNRHDIPFHMVSFLVMLMALKRSLRACVLMAFPTSPSPVHSDTPGMASNVSEAAIDSRFITVKKINILLDDTNYLLWRQQVILAVKTHNLQQFLDSSTTPPPRQILSEDGVLQDNLAFSRFQQQDCALASWLLSSVSAAVLPHLIGLESCAQIWNALLRVCEVISDQEYTAAARSLWFYHRTMKQLLLLLTASQVALQYTRSNTILLDAEAKTKCCLLSELPGSVNLVISCKSQLGGPETSIHPTISSLIKW
ncbi:hypothetical protein GOBAR_AA29568 [Gossypium barbadense]|uniref:Retrotransposon Copia-like N-terminal domain-containing protein n=1 Tax=Gossypium barbadense TaxID=3634 RepID=A0A2P5WJ87_GOSBA|nr:hypothetical protein GOBAR_AA29568 [Gossypium barbadense]